VTETPDAPDLLRLARTEGVGPVAYRRLLARFGSAAAALDALPGLARAGGRASPPHTPSQSDVAREIDRLHRLGGRLLFLGRPGYPTLLAQLDDAPPVLSVLGDPACLQLRCVAMVGSRNASANGSRMADALAWELGKLGIVVVSGLARGIDTAAHEGALRSGLTVACVAGGIDLPYPAENADLQARIARAGCVLAEAPLGTAPMARHFPRRNRIIAGLSLGVVVVEAAMRSGSLITAHMAQDAGREVFAVPGSPLDPRARGANSLLRDGATLTETVQDILDNLPTAPRNPCLPGFSEPPPDLDDPARLVEADPSAVQSGLLALIGPAPTAVDDLIRHCQFSAAAVTSALLELELAGRIEMLPGHRVAVLEPDLP
jgi:DNA processing protein